MYQVNAAKMINTDNSNDELAFETTSIIQQLFNYSILIKVKNFGKIDVTDLNFILMKK